MPCLPVAGTWGRLTTELTGAVACATLKYRTGSWLQRPVERLVRRDAGRTHVKEKCSFCGKPPDGVDWLLKGENAFICSECVEAGMRQIILLREKKEREAQSA